MKILNILLLFTFSFSLSCSQNLFDSVASKNNDEYYLEEATKANNNQQYDLAIQYITESMSAEGQSTTKAKELLASAYAGKCGLNFLNYAESFSNATSGSIFYLMMNPFVGVSVSVSSCVSALSVMDEIGSAASRTTSENTFAAIAGLALMGSAIRGSADLSPVASNGDGTADVNICSGVSDTDMNNIAIGFSYLVENISYVSASLIGSGTVTSLTDLATQCQTYNSGTACVGKTQASVNSTFRQFLRNYINTSTYGVGTYSIVNSNTSAEDSACIACACPIDAATATACTAYGCQ